MPRAPKVVRIDPSTADLSNLLSYRLSVVSNLLSRTQLQRFGSAAGISQHEWRILVLVNSYGPLSVKKLARHAGLDLGQASRLVTRLCEAGYIVKNATTDGRSVDLLLTAPGRALHRKLWLLAMECNDELLASLSPQQRDALLVALDTLAGAAQAALADGHERSAAAKRA